MKVKIYFNDEYKLYEEAPQLDYIDVYRDMDNNREVGWVHILEQENLTYEEIKCLNNDNNIKAWEVIRN